MQTLFEPDGATTSSSKNITLATLLQTSWNALNITRIERIETPKQGWQVTFK
jgi:hypothetical protein